MREPDPLPAPQVLAMLGRDPTEPVVVTRLTGGYRNLLQRIQGEGFDWVVKQYSPPDDNPLFPLLFEDEGQLLTDYEDAGIAPQLIASDLSRRILVYRYVSGDVWNGDLAGIGALLRRVGEVAPRPWLRPLRARVADLRTHTSQILEAVADPPMELLAPFDIADQPFESSVVHTDCGPGNVIGSGGSFTLIDWQCPGQGDPVEDLAAFASPGVQVLYGRAPLTSSEVEDLLTSYGEPEVVARFRWKARLYSARFAAYCAWRLERLSGQPEVFRYREALAAEMEWLRT